MAVSQVDRLWNVGSFLVECAAPPRRRAAG